MPLVDNAPVLRFGEPVKVCKRCNNYKPFMSHHCSTCKRCVRLMDHHCSTLGLICAGEDRGTAGPWGPRTGPGKGVGLGRVGRPGDGVEQQTCTVGDVRGRACERASGANCDHVG